MEVEGAGVLCGHGFRRVAAAAAEARGGMSNVCGCVQRLRLWRLRRVQKLDKKFRTYRRVKLLRFKLRPGPSAFLLA